MDDENIIELYFKRSNKAIIFTQEKYENYLTSISFNILRSIEDSEECVNDTYLKAWETIPPTRPNSLKFYLGKIVRNLSIDLHRSLKAMKRGSGELEVAISELEGILAGNQSIEDTVDEKYLISLINDFLEGSSKEERKLFLFRYFYVYSIKEITKKTGIKENTISTILYRMRNRLKEFLEEGGVSVWVEKNYLTLLGK